MTHSLTHAHTQAHTIAIRRTKAYGKNVNGMGMNCKARIKECYMSKRTSIPREDAERGKRKQRLVYLINK